MDLALSPPDSRLMSPLTPTSPGLDAAIVPEITGDGTKMLVGGGVDKRHTVTGSYAAFVDAVSQHPARVSRSPASHVNAPYTHTLNTPHVQLLETPFDFSAYNGADATPSPPPAAEALTATERDVLAEFLVTDADASLSTPSHTDDDACSRSPVAEQSRHALADTGISWLESSVDLEIEHVDHCIDPLADHDYALPAIESDEVQGINAIVAEIRETERELEMSASPDTVERDDGIFADDVVVNDDDDSADVHMSDAASGDESMSHSATPVSQISLDTYMAEFASRHNSDIALVLDDEAADLDACALPVYDTDEERRETYTKRKYAKRVSRPLTLEERRARKKQQNVEAARRYRLKKNAEKFGASQMLHELKQKNSRLRATLKTTEAEIAMMKNLLHDVRSRLPM